MPPKKTTSLGRKRKSVVENSAVLAMKITRREQGESEYFNIA